jgi:hypothetical protein
MKLSYFIAGQSYENALQAQGLAYLFKSCNPSGSGSRDQDARAGIGAILEGIAENGRRLANLLEENSRNLNFDVDVSWEKPDPIGQVERQCSNASHRTDASAS